jgi:hypothetical protein
MSPSGHDFGKTKRAASVIILDDRLAEAPIGTIWSSSPCKDERRHVDLHDIRREVRLGQRLDEKNGQPYLKKTG